MGDNLGWSFKNVSCPLPGEMLINFGMIGMLIFALFFGFLINGLIILIGKILQTMVLTYLILFIVIWWATFYLYAEEICCHLLRI